MISIPERLTAAHRTEDFDCGTPVLNDWLCRFALTNQQTGTARTYVVCEEERVVGYYSLAVGAVEHAAASARIAKGIARHPIPVMVLARLAVDSRHKGHGIGKGLLKDAILRTLQASELAGIRALLVHAKDEKVRTFYEQYGFEASPLEPLQLLLLLKDARKTLRV